VTASECCQFLGRRCFVNRSDPSSKRQGRARRFGFRRAEPVPRRQGRVGIADRIEVSHRVPRSASRSRHSQATSLHRWRLCSDGGLQRRSKGDASPHLVSGVRCRRPDYGAMTAVIRNRRTWLPVLRASTSTHRLRAVVASRPSAVPTSAERPGNAAQPSHRRPRPGEDRCTGWVNEGDRHRMQAFTEDVHSHDRRPERSRPPVMRCRTPAPLSRRGWLWIRRRSTPR
jgi:hypothetical protein